MHEMALSQQIVETAARAAEDREGRISGICIEVGALSATNVESLSFWLQETLKSRGLGDAEVEMKQPAARVRCECGEDYEADDMFAGCPECGGFSREVVSGKEVTVKWVEVEEDGKEED